MLVSPKLGLVKITTQSKTLLNLYSVDQGCLLAGIALLLIDF